MGRTKGKTTTVTGLSWGDEGKGKIVDWLVANHGYWVVVRHNGANNAGHSVYLDNRLVHLHFIPSGVVHPDGVGLMGAGELLEPFAFWNERLYLERVAGVDPTGRIFLDPRMNLIMLFHRVEDMAREVARKRGTDEEIGTTAKGVGPAYADLAQRPGIRLHHLLGDPTEFEETFRAKLLEKLNLFFGVLGLTHEELRTILQQLRQKDQESCHEILETGAIDPRVFDYSRYYTSSTGLDPSAMIHDYLEIAEQIRALDCVRDIGLEVNRRRVAGENILFEGGQGSLLDVVYGTYPHVTSSHPIAGSACTGTPIGPTFIEEVIGVAKLFTTRVGGGPFPVEDEGFGEQIRGMSGQPGAEYGTTTGRPRRCGPPDTVITRTTALWSSITQLAGTKLDFLDPLEEIKICTQYELGGEKLDLMPMDPKDLDRVEPVFETLPGWQEDTSQARRWSDLPINARRFCDRYLELCQPPIEGADEITWHSIGVGPNREQLIVF